MPQTTEITKITSKTPLLCEGKMGNESKREREQGTHLAPATSISYVWQVLKCKKWVRRHAYSVIRPPLEVVRMFGSASKFATSCRALVATI